LSKSDLIYPENYDNQIICGDNMDALPHIPDNSVDVIVTDPPYGISFMSKDWDKAIPSVAMWRECLRVMKPGAFAFIMSIPRQDSLARMIVNLEDAGFDVGFTSIYWAYATGFPKAGNVSKLVDKRLGAEREVVGIKKHSAGFDEALENKVGFLQDPANRNNTKCFGYGDESLTTPATPEAKALDGSFSGWQPKPAVEVILCVQKPYTDKHRRSDVYRMLGGRYDYWYTQHTEVKAPKGEQKGNIDQLSKKWKDELAQIGYKLKDGDVIERRLALTPDNVDEVVVNRQ